MKKLEKQSTLCVEVEDKYTDHHVQFIDLGHFLLGLAKNFLVLPYVYTSFGCRISLMEHKIKFLGKDSDNSTEIFNKLIQGISWKVKVNM